MTDQEKTDPQAAGTQDELTLEDLDAQDVRGGHYDPDKKKEILGTSSDVIGDTGGTSSYTLQRNESDLY
jgi:hypothetical protein